jgi:hypothetical protein
MKCPYCGFDLIIADHPEIPDVDWGLDGEELDQAIKRAQRAEKQQHAAQACKCTNPKCVWYEKNPDAQGMLLLHHPFDTDRERGDDSWSISYIN